MADALKNFAYSTVATAPSPATTGTSLVVAAGDGAKFPPVPFNATIWPPGQAPTTANAEVVRVTAIATDTLTITRNVEGSSARSVLIADQICATISAAFLGLGLVNRKPSYDATIPDGHSVVVSGDYNIGGTVTITLAGDARLGVI